MTSSAASQSDERSVELGGGGCPRRSVRARRLAGPCWPPRSATEHRLRPAPGPAGRPPPRCSVPPAALPPRGIDRRAATRSRGSQPSPPPPPPPGLRRTRPPSSVLAVPGRGQTGLRASRGGGDAPGLSDPPRPAPLPRVLGKPDESEPNYCACRTRLPVFAHPGSKYPLGRALNPVRAGRPQLGRRQLDRAGGRGEEEERKLACARAPLGLGARRGHPRAKGKGRVCRGAPPGQTGPSAGPRANKIQIKSPRLAEAVVRACWQPRRWAVVSALAITYEIWSRGRGSPGRGSLATERGVGSGGRLGPAWGGLRTLGKDGPADAAAPHASRFGACDPGVSQCGGTAPQGLCGPEGVQVLPKGHCSLPRPPEPAAPPVNAAGPGLSAPPDPAPRGSWSGTGGRQGLRGADENKSFAGGARRGESGGGGRVEEIPHKQSRPSRSAQGKGWGAPARPPSRPPPRQPHRSSRPPPGRFLCPALRSRNLLLDEGTSLLSGGPWRPLGAPARGDIRRASASQQGRQKYPRPRRQPSSSTRGVSPERAASKQPRKPVSLGGEAWAVHVNLRVQRRTLRRLSLGSWEAWGTGPPQNGMLPVRSTHHDPDELAGPPGAPSEGHIWHSSSPSRTQELNTPECAGEPAPSCSFVLAFASPCSLPPPSPQSSHPFSPFLAFPNARSPAGRGEAVGTKEPLRTDVVGSNWKVWRMPPWPPAGIPGPREKRRRGWGRERSESTAAARRGPSQGRGPPVGRAAPIRGAARPLTPSWALRGPAR
ncbi:collagen alpha-1(I) chain-like [Meriones unguiculatus]|uniref:collagen alpha-1(I) chain-like n=1 Tax=Meriones unguiculatus TaxID=10047 RepID=UPI000B4F2CAE|nr:collagen alpha-1(I) chain-like [Meriones unguiculatus]